MIKDLDEGSGIDLSVTIHLGKVSAGWQFLFDGSHGLFKDYNSMENFIKDFGGRIVNEYGDTVEVEDLLKSIRESSLEKRHTGQDMHLYNGCSYSNVTFS